jgi:hypothetical protein
MTATSTAPVTPAPPMTKADWLAEGERRFGKNTADWRFSCPVCHHIARVQDWDDVGAGEAFGFSCIGRYLPSPARDAFGDKDAPGPCNYAGGGLFRLNPVRVVDDEGRVHEMFAFAEPVA